MKKIKKPIYKMREMPAEVQNRFLCIPFVGLFLFLLCLSYGIYKKDLEIALSGIIIIVISAILMLYMYYLFTYDKVGVIEGKVYKIVNRHGVYNKYKEVYIKNESDITYIMTVSKRKREYINGAILRIYIKPSDVYYENDNTYTIRNSIIAKVIRAEYEEGVSEDRSDNIRKSIFKNGN